MTGINVCHSSFCPCLDTLGGEQRHRGCPGELQKEDMDGGSGNPAQATSLWCMLYAIDAAVITDNLDSSGR